MDWYYNHCQYELERAYERLAETWIMILHWNNNYDRIEWLELYMKFDEERIEYLKTVKQRKTYIQQKLF